MTLFCEEHKKPYAMNSKKHRYECPEGCVFLDVY